MSRNKQSIRIVIALTETCPVGALWKTALQAASESPTELVAVYLHDERWHRAASLSFTREISIVGGGTSEFTRQRAAQLTTEAVAMMRSRIEELAKKTGHEVTFEVLPESDQTQAQALFGQDDSIVVSSSLLAAHPLIEALRRLNLRVLLVE